MSLTSGEVLKLECFKKTVTTIFMYYEQHSLLPIGWVQEMPV